MTTMLALLAMKPPIDGEDAVAIARRFLIGMGIPNVGGLGHLSQQEWGGRQSGKVWATGFDLPPDGWFTVNVDKRGTVVYACRDSQKGSASLMDGATARRYAKALMARVPNALPVRMGDVGRGMMAAASIQFYALLDGRRYFNLNPTYGYYLSFDAKGHLTWFGRQDSPPPPAARVSKIGQAAAVVRLTNAWKAKDHAKDWPYPRHVVPELGYYAVKNQPKARLVWRGEVFSTIHGHESQFATLDTFVDATTGALIEADDR